MWATFLCAAHFPLPHNPASAHLSHSLLEPVKASFASGHVTSLEADKRCAPTSHLHRIGSFALAGPGKSGCSCTWASAARASWMLHRCLPDSVAVLAWSYLACARTAAPRKAKAVCLYSLKLAHSVSWPGLAIFGGPACRGYEHEHHSTTNVMEAALLIRGHACI